MGDKAQDLGSGSSSNVGSGISGFGSGSGSHSGSRSVTNFGVNSSSSSVFQVLDQNGVPMMVLPATVMGQLDEEKREMMESVMAKVVQKTGAELAEMQAALDKSRKTTSVVNEDKEELEARVAKLR